MFTFGFVFYFLNSIAIRSVQFYLRHWSLFHLNLSAISGNTFSSCKSCFLDSFLEITGNERHLGINWSTFVWGILNGNGHCSLPLGVTNEARCQDASTFYGFNYMFIIQREHTIDASCPDFV